MDSEGVNQITKAFIRKLKEFNIIFPLPLKVASKDCLIISYTANLGLNL